MEWFDAATPRVIAPVEAVPLLQQAVRHRPAAVSLHIQLGSMLSQLDRFEDAATAFGNAVALDPSRADAWFELGKIYTTLKRFTDACEAFARVVRCAPNHAGAYSAMGVALEALGRSEEAWPLYEQALALDPHNFTASERLALHFCRGNNAAGLLEWCNDLLRRGGYNTHLLTLKFHALGKLGRDTELEAFVDFDHLLYADYLTSPAGHESLVSLNRDVLVSVKHNPTLRYEEPGKATRQGWHTQCLTCTGDHAILALLTQIRRAITHYVDTLPADTAHPFIQARPAQARLDSWAILLHADGYLEPHTHPSGWLSGVYYVTVPPHVDATSDYQGWIEFGPPPADSFTRGVDWPQRWIKPEAGKILLFPSYLYHTTRPTGVDGDRLSIAFDVIPTLSA